MPGFVSSTAGLIALTVAFITDFREVLTVSFGADLRDNFVAFLVAITVLREPPCTDFRALFDLGRFRDIIPSDSWGVENSRYPQTALSDSDVKEKEKRQTPLWRVLLPKPVGHYKRKPSRMRLLCFGL